MRVKSAGPSATNTRQFQPEAFFRKNGKKQTASGYRQKQIIFSQGDPGAEVLYIHQGRVKLTVLSNQGKEATIGLLRDGDFLGEECLAPDQPSRSATAVAITDCLVFSIGRDQMSRALEREHAFRDLFVSRLLTRKIRIQEDLVDQLFNSTEKRLARALLLLSHFGGNGEPRVSIPKVSQEVLAAMVGTSRTRVNYFMNKFRKLGFIDYNGELHVHNSLVKILLHN
jgi:CRP/FNR family transcriptional regulator, cyclic AMP receptor protein